MLFFFRKLSFSIAGVVCYAEDMNVLIFKVMWNLDIIRLIFLFLSDMDQEYTDKEALISRVQQLERGMQP